MRSVGSGKTTLVGALCVLLRDELSLAVVTNDIFTSEDAEALRRAAVLPTERIVAVETGCCPHTAIRDDIAANLDAVETLEAALAPVDVTLIESGGDNLTAIFSRGLVDAQIFVLDTAGGDDVPRKGGPGVASADLLVINKTDLAPYVRVDVERMLTDATARRAGPVLPTSLVDATGAGAVADWVRTVVAAWRA
jgi:urease accessory protein